MKGQKIKIELSSGKTTGYEVVIGRGLLGHSGKWARKCLGNSDAKLVIVSNPTIFGLYGKQVSDLFADAGFTVSHYLMRDGEQHKTLATAESALKFFAESGLSRTDAVVALGGGIVGDVAGFASAIYLRGISFLQIPTTFLSMIDSSVGGKTGVNSPFGKNLIGAFHQPQGVLIDSATLQTLPSRELTAGFCEAVKQGAIGGKKLLSQTADFLTHYSPDGIGRFADSRTFHAEISNLIGAHVAFKAGVVANDERESSNRTDGKSRKILNFGHTLAHALEKVTDYKCFKHGEAVGYGIMFAAELSKSLALLDGKDVKLLNDILHRVGPLPRLANIARREVFEAFSFDKKQLSGSLQMVLLRGIGKPVIVSEKEIPRSTTQKVLKKLLQEYS